MATSRRGKKGHSTARAPAPQETAPVVVMEQRLLVLEWQRGTIFSLGRRPQSPPRLGRFNGGLTRLFGWTGRCQAEDELIATRVGIPEVVTWRYANSSSSATFPRSAVSSASSCAARQRSRTRRCGNSD